MSNHFHLLMRQEEAGAITKFMLRLCTSYAKYFNIKYELVGRLFQERFRAKLVETDEYLLHLSRYIHLNPISDNLEDLKNLRSTPGVERKEIHEQLVNYQWSSYREYCGPTKGLRETQFILNYFSKTNPQNSYEEFVEAAISTQESEFIAPYLEKL